MTINLEQFQEVFLEECAENLDILEQGLLALGNRNTNDVDDTVNNIFRAAHSIKGGAATFNFVDIAEITHEIESILDQVREATKQLCEADISNILSAVDSVRRILDMRKSNDQSPLSDHQEIIYLLKSMLNDNVGNKKTESYDEIKSEKPEISNVTINQNYIGWNIDFTPGRHLFLTGNDPILFVRELGDLGELSVKTNLKHMPELHCYDPESCYLAWNIELKGSVKEEEILNTFEWIIDDCHLNIKPLEQEEVGSTENNNIDEYSDGLVTDNTQQTATTTDKQEQINTINTTSQSIRVSVDKVDNLFNLVGELVITQSMLSELGSHFSVENLDCVDRLQSGLTQLLQNTKELQESVMRVRMVPISFIFKRFPRIVHDLEIQLDKKVELILEGEDTELDKNVMEQLADPLMHLVRNSLDHGIESAECRLQANKSTTGTIKLSACHRGGNIVIEINDDGAGLNKEVILKKAQDKGLVKSSEHLTDTQIFELIFEPGFSTAEAVTDISGRGVGMDVVRKNIYSLGGSITVDSEPATYTRFQVTLPLTLAILDGQLVKVGSETYVVPLNAIVESLQMVPESIQQVSGALEVYRLRQENIPVIRLYQLLDLEAAVTHLENALLVVVEVDGNKFGLLVDDLLAQQQVVIKSLEANYDKVPGISGATILGDGTVALILDVSGLVRLITDEFFFKPCAA